MRPYAAALRIKLRALSLIALTVVCLGGLPVAASAEEEWKIDQAHAGNPACTEDNFSGFVVSTDDLRQEFVPSAGTLNQVDLCLKIITPGTELTLNIYEAREGEPVTVKPPLSQQRRSVNVRPEVGTNWTHVKLDPSVSLAPGKRHILEIPKTQVTFQWRAACGTTLVPCTRTLDPYAKGNSNFHPTVVDFGFRTRVANLPDLAGALSGPRVTCPGQTLGDSVNATITNVQPNASSPSRATLYMSSDQSITTSDPVIATVAVPSLEGGASFRPSFAASRIPLSLPPELLPDRRAYFGLIIDDANDVQESNEENNVVAARTAITACSHASLAGLKLEVDRTETTPGAFRVPIEDIDVEDLPIVAEESATVASFDVASTPLRPIDLASLFDGAPRSALDAILLSSIPYCCWRDVLDQPGSPFVGQPLHAVTLGDVLSLDTDLTLQETSLGLTGLKGITAAALLSAGTALDDLGQPGEAWCALLGRNDVDCPKLGVDPATDTLLDLNLLGFRALPWSAMPPVADMNLAAGAPLRTTPLAGSSPTDHYQISQTPFRTIRVAQLSDASAIIDCSDLPNGCGASSPDTLGTAETSNAFKAGANVGQLLDRVPAGTPVTLGQAALGIFSREDLAWELMDYDRFRPQEAEPFGSPLTYTATFTNDGPVALVDPTIEVGLPQNFVAPSQPATVSSPAGSKASSPLTIGNAVRFTTEAFVRPGETFSLSFKAFPWVRLGRFDSSVKVSWVDAGALLPDDPHEVSRANQAQVRVVDIERDVPNSEPVFSGPGAAPTLEPDTLLFTTIGADDEDFFVIPEQVAGSRVRISMTSLAPSDAEPDFDVALYRASSGALDSLPLRPIDLASLPVQEDGWEVNSTGSRLSPEMLEDLPLRPIDLASLSVNRGGSDEAMSMTVSSGDGPLLVHVFGYNGAFGPDPVALRVKVTRPASLGPCTTPAPAFTGERATQLTWTAPGFTNADVNTLFVFDQQRTGAISGPAQATALRAKLEQVAARGDLGVKGSILSIDADPRAPVPGDPGATVPTARAASDASPCSVEASNDLVRATTSLMADVRPTFPNLDTVVVVGNNDMVPHYFARDYTWKSNEQDNVQDMLDATGNTVLTTAMATRHFATDAQYGAEDAIAFMNERIFAPKFRLGRLTADTAGGVIGQLDRFIAANGRIDPTKAAVASIDILNDSAEQLADSLESRLGVSVARLDDELGDPSDGWTADRYRDEVLNPVGGRDIVSTGAHATHAAIGASRGGVVRASEISGSTIPAGVLAVSNGCHFGVNLPNRMVSDPARAMDWTEEYLKKGAAAVIGSSGFAYADRSAGSAYSEDLLERFGSWIGTGTLGDAWKNAVNGYLDSLIAVDAFDHKTLGEFVFNGMPHYRVGAGDATPPTVPNVVGAVAPDETGLPAGPVSLSFSPTDPKSQRVERPDGSYYTWGGDSEAKNGFPIVARFVGAANKPGLRVQDILVTGLTTIDEPNDPVFAGAIVSSKETNEIQSATAISPSLPVRVTPNGNAVFRLGRFRAERVLGGKVSGTLTRVTGVEGKAYYGTGGVRPEFRLSEVELAGSALDPKVRFRVRMSSETTPLLVSGLFQDAAGWHYVKFSKSVSDPAVWTAEAPIVGTVLRDTFLQALGPTGRIGVTVLKGSTDSLANLIKLDGVRGLNGWFRDDVTVTLNEADGVDYEYSLNSPDLNDYTGPFEIAGDRVHHLAIYGSDRTTARVSIPIDTQQPTVTVTSPAQGAVFNFGDPVFAQFDCSDATSGISSCSASLDGAPISRGGSLTRTAGQHTLVVTGVDVAGHVTVVSRTYSVVGHTLKGFFDPVDKRPPLLNDANAGKTIPLKWKVFGPDGTEKTSTSVVQGVFVGRISCAAPADTKQWGALSQAVSDPALSYSGQFHFNAQTEKTLAGQCSRYVARHEDGSELLVFVRHTS